MMNHRTWVQVFFRCIYAHIYAYFYEQLCNIGRLSQGWRKKWGICNRNYCDSSHNSIQEHHENHQWSPHDTHWRSQGECSTNLNDYRDHEDSQKKRASDTVSNAGVMLQTSQPWSKHGAEGVRSRDSESMYPILVFAHSAYLFSHTYDTRSRELKAAKAGHQRSHRRGDSLIKWTVYHFQAPIHTFIGISLGLKLDNYRYSRITAVFRRVKNKWNFHMSRLESIMKLMKVQTFRRDRFTSDKLRYPQNIAK
jgi:hypothetical protein